MKKRWRENNQLPRFPRIVCSTLLVFCLVGITAQQSIVAPNTAALGVTEEPFILCLDDERAIYPHCGAMLSVAQSAAAPDGDGAVCAGHELREYLGFSLCYREDYEQPEWVAYVLTAAEVVGTEKRRNDFREDPDITTGSAAAADYYKSGYDRGHLAPAADMKWSEEAMSSSFFMTNMSPQVPSFNRGIWSKLEQMVRDWAVLYGAVAVVTGPVLEKDRYPVIGENRVAVPEFFYKALLAAAPDGTLRCCAFILPNAKATEPVASYICTVDDLEARTGIDFFSFLPDREEDTMEASVIWDFLP